MSEGFLVGRTVALLIISTPVCLLVAFLFLRGGEVRLAAAMLVIPLDLVLWAVISLSLSSATRAPAVLGLVVIFPLALLLHPFLWLMLESTYAIGSVPHRAIILCTGPGLLIWYGVKVGLMVILRRALMNSFDERLARELEAN